MLAPSGPGLCDLERDTDYRDALLGSDVNLTDSGLVVLVEALRYRRKLPRASGLGYLEALLARAEVKRAGGTFWVMPSTEATARNVAWLRSHGVEVTDDDCYVAPCIHAAGASKIARSPSCSTSAAPTMSSSASEAGLRRSSGSF